MCPQTTGGFGENQGVSPADRSYLVDWLFMAVATLMLRTEQIVMLWGILMGCSIGLTGSSLFAGFAAALGAGLGLVSLQATTMLLVGNTTGLTHLALYGLVDKRPWVVLAVTVVILVMGVTGLDLLTGVLTALSTAAGLLRGMQIGTLIPGFPVWVIALVCDPSAAHQLLLGLVAAGVVAFALLSHHRNKLRNAQRNDSVSDELVKGLLMVSGVLAVFVPGQEVSGIIMAGVGLLSRYWGFWRDELVAERTGALVSSHPSRMDAKTDEIVANRTYYNVPTSDWAFCDLWWSMEYEW